MLVRKLTTPKEYLDSEKIMSIAFIGTLDVEKTQKRLDEEGPDPLVETWGAFDEEGRMTSTMVNHLYQIQFDGHTVDCGGVGGVSSLPEHRRSGHIRAIFQEKLTDMKKRGFVFSMLYPFSHPYYRQFGYELSYPTLRQSVPLEDLKGYACPYQARMLDGEDCLEPLKEVYNAFIQGRNLSVRRQGSQWDCLKTQPLRNKEYCYLLYDDSGPHAYIIFQAARDAQGRMRALSREFAWDGIEAFQGLLGFLYRLSAQYKQVQFNQLPNQVDLTALIPEPYHVQSENNCHGMLRVVDVAQMLALLSHPQGEGQYRLQVRDDFLPENSGTYTVCFQDGKALTVEKGEGPADLTLSVQALAPLCVGAVNLAQALYRPDVRLYGNKDILASVFVSKPLYLSDAF